MRVFFAALNKAWQYMLSIPNPAHWLKVVKDVLYQQMLLAEIISFKYETMARFLKRDWKAVEMAKKTMIDLIRHIQPVMTALKKNFGNWSKTLSDKKNYWGQAFYNWFYNFNKMFASDKFFCHLETIEKQYKSSQMLVAFWALNNITSYRLLTTLCRVLVDHYCY